MSKNETYIIHNGRKCLPDWPQKIELAQRQSVCLIEGVKHLRVAYGYEHFHRNGDVSESCPDCCVEEGQYHVMGCDVEECPHCMEQAIGCSCEAEVLEDLKFSKRIEQEQKELAEEIDEMIDRLFED